MREFQALTQLTEPISVGIGWGFQPRKINVPLLGETLHQAEADHAQGLICVYLRKGHGYQALLSGRYRL